MRETKLSRFCDGLLEMGWLAALVLAPLFFNTYSSRVFEPDKIALVRSIALVMAAAWALKLLEQGGLHTEVVDVHPRRRLESIGRLPLALPLAILLSAFLLSTLLSVAPRISFWGSYTRLQGAYTTLAYVVIFAAIAVNLRRREQVERLITTVILASLPVSLYGVLQRLQLDPLPWAEDTSTRVTSTMGNAIFIAAYLIMTLPLTAMRATESFRAILREETGLTRNVARGAVYVFAGLMQAFALWFSGSRGPWLGALAGMFFWSILLSLVFRRRRATLAILGTAALAAVFLIALNIPAGPLEPLRNTERLGRMGRVFEVEDGTSKVRVLIWGGAVEMMLPHDPILFPDRRPDPFNLIRPLVGYGPESMYVAYNRFYPPELAHYERRTASPDRSHNETFDALVTTGLAGLLAYLTFFGAVIYYALKWLGVLTERDRWLYFGLYVGGGVAGAAALVAWRGPSYFGVGLPFGMLIGLLACLALLAVRRSAGDIDTWSALILITMLSAIVAHFTEIHFGIAIVSTRLHFWAYAGVLVAVGWAMPRKAALDRAGAAAQPIPGSGRSAVEGGPGRPRRGRSGRAARSPARPEVVSGNLFAPVVPAVLSALVLITMSYGFLANASRSTGTGAMLVGSLTTLFGTSGGTSYGVLILFATVWLAAGAMWSEDAQSAALTLGGALAAWLAFAFYHLGTLGAIAARQPADVGELVQTVTRLLTVLTGFYGWVMVLGVLGAIALAADWPATYFGTAGMVLAPLVFAMAIVLGSFTNRLVIQADMVYKVAQPWDREGRMEVVIPLYSQAVRLAPLEDQYYLYLARAYLAAASASADPLEQHDLVGAAASELQIAQRLNPLNPDHAANLARTYQRWARLTSDQAQASAHLQQAEDYYSTALLLSPNSALLWNEWARFDLVMRQDYDGALAKLETSLALDSQFNETYAALGDYWAQAAKRETDPSARRSKYETAAGYYRQAIEAEAFKPDTPKSLLARLGLGLAQQALGDWDGVIQTYEEVVELAGPGYNLWAVYQALGEAYLEKGARAQALEYARKALAAADDEDKAAVQTLIARIEGP